MKRVLLALVPLLMLMSALVTHGASAQDTATTLKVANDPNLGAILTDAKGMTVYLFTKDTTASQSNCTDKCLQNWPAVPATDNMTLPKGVPGKLTSFDRADGTKQAAYNGIPLYTFANDKAAGDVNGQDVGGIWFVVYPGAEFGPYAPAVGDGTPVPQATLHVGFTEDLGPFLTDAKGMTIYFLTTDTTAGKSTCSGDCAAEWPVVPGTADALLPVGIQGTLSSFAGEGGSMQLAYNDIPLYFFVDDKAAGDLTGQDKDSFYVVTPGMKLGDAPHEASSSESEGTATPGY